MVNIQVLTLSDCIERQQKIKQQLDNLSLSFSFFYGVDGRNGEHSLFSKYNKELRLAQGKPQLNKGELGCFASHYLLWEKCIELQNPILVLEDDAILDTELFLNFISNIDVKNSTLECVRLFESKRQDIELGVKSDVKLSDTLTATWHDKGFSSATGYYLTPAGAEKLLKYADVWQMEVDNYMDRFWEHDVLPFGVYPPCLTNDESLESNIHPNKKRSKRTRVERLKSEWFNCKEIVARTAYNFRLSL